MTKIINIQNGLYTFEDLTFFSLFYCILKKVYNQRILIFVFPFFSKLYYKISMSWYLFKNSPER